MESKCVVCGCTDSRGCEAGCEWVCLTPPICNQCVQSFIVARLWRVVFALEGKAKGKDARACRELREHYETLQKVAGELPSLAAICRINRKVEKVLNG